MKKNEVRVVDVRSGLQLAMALFDIGFADDKHCKAVNDIKQAIGDKETAFKANFMDVTYKPTVNAWKQAELVFWKTAYRVFLNKFEQAVEDNDEQYTVNDCLRATVSICGEVSDGFGKLRMKETPEQILARVIIQMEPHADTEFLMDINELDDWLSGCTAG